MEKLVKFLQLASVNQLMDSLLVTPRTTSKSMRELVKDRMGLKGITTSSAIGPNGIWNGETLI